MGCLISSGGRDARGSSRGDAWRQLPLPEEPPCPRLIGSADDGRSLRGNVRQLSFRPGLEAGWRLVGELGCAPDPPRGFDSAERGLGKWRQSLDVV